MTHPTTGLLQVPGATLYYEVRGSGPTLLMISPGLGDCGFYTRVAELLADTYQVVTYDRRGNSRSPLADPDDDLDLAVQSEDARRVLAEVGTSPAYVFGGSGGAIVGVDLAASRPDLVRRLVAHEPPVVRLLSDGDQWLSFFDRVYDIYRREGVMAAMATFEASYRVVSQELDLEPDLPEPGLPERMHGNFDYFIGHEMRQFVRYQPDVGSLATFAARGGRLVLGGGVSSRAGYPYLCAVALRERLGEDSAGFCEFEGEHAGYLTRPRGFAARLRAVLAAGEREPAA